MDFRSASYRNGLIGVGVIAALLAGLGVLIHLLTAWPFTLPAFGLGVGILLLLAALVALVYWTVATLGLSYRLDRNGVRIRWGASQTIVPIRNIQTIVPVERAPTELGLLANTICRVTTRPAPGRAGRLYGTSLPGDLQCVIGSRLSSRLSAPVPAACSLLRSGR